MKKFIYVDRFMLRKSLRKKIILSNELKIWTKKSLITNCLNLGTRVQIYNGSKFANLTIARDMQGYVLVNFVLLSVLQLIFTQNQQKMSKF